LDWLSDDNRAGLSDGSPSAPQPSATAQPTATQSNCAGRPSSSDWQKRWGARRSRDWSPRKGRRFEFLPRRKPCRKYGRSAVSSFNLESGFSCLAGASGVCCCEPRKETLRLAKLDSSSHRATADGSSGFMSVAITKPTKEIAQSNHSGSHAGTASQPHQKIVRTLLGTRSGRSSGARLENGRVIPHIPHGVRREPRNRPCQMIYQNRAGRESLAKCNIGSGSLIHTVVENCP
jgi:hypothetical protein